MLEFLRHPKAKIRKCSQDAVKLIVASCSASNITNLTANYCLKTIEETGSKCQIGAYRHFRPQLTSTILYLFHSDNAENTAQIMHMLVFIKQIINEFSLNSLKSIFEYLFRLLAFNNIVRIPISKWTIKRELCDDPRLPFGSTYQMPSADRGHKILFYFRNKPIIGFTCRRTGALIFTALVFRYTEAAFFETCFF
jgi:hypothetical protein